MSGSLFSTFVFLIITTAGAEEPPAPLAQRQACAKFSDAVVRIEAGGKSRGSGFLVSSDGIVLTASHVVRDESNGYFSAIQVMLPDGTPEFAHPFVPLTGDSVGQDFAVLKVEKGSGLPFLKLGSVADVVVGSTATIIGFPFSAVREDVGARIKTKFCVSATISAQDLTTVPIEGRKGDATIKRDVKVDTIYFQGPAVKGLSGSPIISLDTGTAIGIVSQRLTGIGNQLDQFRRESAGAEKWEKQSEVIIQGTRNPALATLRVVNLLDEQLANGLGAATGIDDPKHALAMEQRKHKH